MKKIEYIPKFTVGATGSDMVATVDYHSSGGMRTYEGRTPLVE